MSPEDFRRYGHELIDWLADYHESLADRPVMAKTRPGEIRDALPSAPPNEPEDFGAAIADLDRLVVPGLSLWQHPRFFGYFPANALLAGILGDLVSTGLGVIGLSWQSSPAVTEIEEVVTDWLRQMLGLSPAWSGVIQDTASTSTLVALICARERATNYALARGGLQGETRTPRVYVSAHAHSSVDKGALLAGFGRDNLRLVPFDAKYAMRADALAEMIAEDLADGDLPCAIVATVGTTATTAIDPIAAIAEIARRHGIWLHVDAAMAGSAMILPECRWMWEGVEGADSLVINAHKWLGAPFDCSVYYVRDPEHLMRVMSTNPSFLQSSVDGAGQEPARLGHPARAPLPGAETLVRHPRTGGERIAEAPAPRHGQCALACGRGRRDAGLARASRRFPCRPSACATSRKVSKARRSTPTRPPGSRRSIARARPI